MSQPRTMMTSYTLMGVCLVLFGCQLALHAYGLLAFINGEALLDATPMDFILRATQATIYAVFAYYVSGKWSRYDRSETERLCAPIIRRSMVLALVPAYTAALLGVLSFAAPWTEVLLWALDMLLIAANGLGITLWLARELPEVTFSRFQQCAQAINRPLILDGLIVWFALIILALVATFA